MAETYRFSTSASTAEAFVQRLLARGDTQITDDPIPHPPGEHLLVNVDDPGRIRIRHYASPTEVPSPILRVDCTPTTGGMKLECEVLRSDAPFSAADRAPPEPLEPEPLDAWDVLDPVDAVSERLFVLLLRGLFGIIRSACLGVAWVFKRIFGAWQHRRGMSLYGAKMVAAVKAAAEVEDS